MRWGAHKTDVYTCPQVLTFTWVGYGWNSAENLVRHLAGQQKLCYFAIISPFGPLALPSPEVTLQMMQK